MSEYRVVNECPYSPERVWRALTDPALVPLWTAKVERRTIRNRGIGHFLRDIWPPILSRSTLKGGHFP